MEKWVVEKWWEIWAQRRDVENDEKYDGMCDKYCDGGRGDVELCCYFIRGCSGMYAITHFILGIYS